MSELTNSLLNINFGNFSVRFLEGGGGGEGGGCAFPLD